MTIAVVKQKLHSYIDQANMDELEVICKLLEGNKGMSIDDETIAELDNRWNNYTSGTSKTYTLQVFSENIKNSRSNTPSQVYPPHLGYPYFTSSAATIPATIQQ